MFALPAAASAIATAAPAAAATAAKVSVMATLKSVAFNALTNLAISSALSVFQPQVGGGLGRTFEFVIDPDGPIPFAAGTVGVAGSVIHRDTFGPDLMFYGIPAILSGAGPITAIQSVKVDDYPMAFDANGGATTEPYRYELYFRSVLGHQPAPVALATPSGLKNNATLPGWTANHKLSGKAAFLMVMAENSKGSAWPTGEGKPLIEMLGLKGWDPTLDSTYPGGSGPCRLHDSSTWVTLTCPILWGLKWSLGLWEGPTLKGSPAHGSTTDYQVGGIGARLSGVDVPAFVAASNIAKANNWTVSAYPNTDDDKHQVLTAFLQAGGAIYAQRAGKISCISRAAPRSSIVTISAVDTAGPLEIDTAASRIDRKNTLRPRFWSPAHRWQMQALDGEVTAQAYIDEDGGRVRSSGIDYPYVSNAKQAAQLAALQIANTRENIAGVIPLKPHMQRIRPGDGFTITEAGFVLNGLKCLCLNTEYDSATGVVRVSFVSETDGKYPFALGQNPTPPEPQVLTPVDPRFVSPPEAGDWTITPRPPAPGGGQLPGFDLSGVVSNDTATAIIVETGPTSDGPWTQAYQGPPTVTNIPVDGLQPGATYYVAIQYQRNQNYSARHVYGPYEAPPLVAGDVSPSGSTITAMQDVIDAAEVAVSSLNAAVYTPGTGLLDRADALSASLNTPTTGVLARLASAETKQADDNAAAVGRLNAMEATVNTAGTGLLARMATQETATSNLQTGKADVGRVASLEATVNTPGTGVSARLTTVEGVAASADGTARAISGLVLDVNGYVSGHSSVNDGVTAQFEILADVFAIRAPGGGERTEYRAGNWFVYSPAEATRTRYGKAFGGAQKITWWTGPDSVAEGSETKANAYVYISQNTNSGPRFGGTDVVGAGGGAAKKTFAGVVTLPSSTAWTDVASFVFASGVPNPPVIDLALQVTGGGPPSSGLFYNCATRWVERNGSGDTVLGSGGSIGGNYNNTDGVMEWSSDTAIATNRLGAKSGAVTYVLQAQRVGGTNASITTNASGYVSVVQSA